MLFQIHTVLRKLSVPRDQASDTRHIVPIELAARIVPIHCGLVHTVARDVDIAPHNRATRPDPPAPLIHDTTSRRFSYYASYAPSGSLRLTTRVHYFFTPLQNASLVVRVVSTEVHHQIEAKGLPFVHRVARVAVVRRPTTLCLSDGATVNHVRLVARLWNAQLTDHIITKNPEYQTEICTSPAPASTVTLNTLTA